MKNIENRSFEIYIKTKIIFGVDSRFRIGRILKNKNYQKVLICIDKNIIKLKYINEIFDNISGEGIEYEIYDGVEINPTIMMIMDACQKFRKYNFDCILGIGGGSSIDLAKGISVALTHEGNIYNYVSEIENQKKLITDAVKPIIAVPTAAGSGAEVSPVSVIVDQRRKLKTGFFSEYLFPLVAVIDSVVHTTLPPKTTAECGLDILSHAFDAFVSPYSNSFSDALAIKSIEMVFKNLKSAVFDGKNLESRSEMAMASILGLIAIYAGKGGSTHTIAEPLGGLYNIPHGYACGVALPAMMEFLLSDCSDKFAVIYRNINKSFNPEEEDEDLAKRCIKETKRLILDLGIDPPWKEISNPDIGLLSKYSIKHMAVDRVPREITRQDYVKLYEEIFGKSYF